MINILFYGDTPDYFYDAFDDISVVSYTSTSLVLLDATSGFRTTLTGVGIAEDSSKESDFRGTITGVSTTNSSGAAVLTATSLNWEINTFDAAIAAYSQGNESLLTALLSSDDIFLDASGASEGVELSHLLRRVTSNVTIKGSDYEDRLSGGAGNDVITPGLGSIDEGDFIRASAGNDTINLTGIDDEHYVALVYSRMNDHITVNYDGANNTATVQKTGQGLDTIIDPNAAVWGLEFVGSEGNDVFNVAPDSDVFTTVQGDQGNDIINITSTGVVRVSYRYGWNESPTMGIVADLSTGIVSNDGFGGRDTINITDGGDRVEIRGTLFADSIKGSDASERFILESGADTLDAGGGDRDLLRYDRSEVGYVNVDLAAGTATGTFYSEQFNHSIAGIEEVRGSRNGNDTISGSDAAERFEGRGGNDVLIGLGGDDSLYGDAGNDSLYGGAGTDNLQGWEGDDYINPGDNTNYDYVNAHTGNDTIDAVDMVTGYLDVAHWNLADTAGQTINVDGAANTASIYKGLFNGTTTFLNVNNAMQADGLGISGSNLGDVFNVVSAEGGYLQLSGGRGNDVFNIGASSGTVRLDYRDDARGETDATSGLVLNLSTGVVANDGFGGSDTINADAGARIEIQGTDLADMITGSEGNDRFVTQGGNDTVDGGAGADLIRYDRSNMTSGVDVDLAAGTATGMWEGTVFTDSLASIEAVRGSGYDDRMSGTTVANEFQGRDGDDALYGDGIQANLTGAVAGQVYRMYQATLDRAPDAAGYEGWVTGLFEGTLGLDQMARGFVNSPEFKATYGSLDNSGFVELLYQNVLGRAADAGGLQGWLDAMAAGTTREGVVIGFSQSNEFKLSTGQASADFAMSQSEMVWTDEIYRVYRATLDRDPDVAGFLGWAELLGSGTGFDTMIGGFVNSPEFKATYGNLDNAGFVELLYQNVLDRSADAGGLQGWLDAMDAGTSRAGVVRGFSQSSEFQLGTAAELKAWVQAQGTHDVLNGGGGANILSGGLLQDQFIFEAGESSTTKIMDFEWWDVVQLNGFAINSFADFQNRLEAGSTGLIFEAEGVSILFDNVVVIAEDQVLF